MVWVFRIAILSLIFGCAYPHRPGYDRNIGGYPESSYNKKRSESHRTNKPSPSTDASLLKKAIKPWLGTPYVYGGQSKSGTDCSGFVRQIYLKVYDLDIPHSTKQAWSFGQAILKSDLKPGDVVFFGSFVGVEHNGIYVGNNSFAHASTSKGVMYESLDHPYWAPKYQGARRYIW